MSEVVGLTSGCFDLFHFGHLNYLRRCKDQCDKLIVAVDCDEMVRAVKGPNRPIFPQRQRKALVESVRYVDTACVINSLDDLHYISKLFCVKKVFKNERFLDIRPVIGQHDTTAELIIIPDVEGMPETTQIVERILERYKDR